MTEVRMLAAIAAVRTAAAKQRAEGHVSEQVRVEAIRAVVERFRTSYAEELTSVDQRIAKCLLPIDPLRQTWNVFRLFDIEYAETRWTQWFAGIMRAENSELCARLAWSAFCEAVAQRATRMPPVPQAEDDLADAACWTAIALELPEVEDEVPDGKLGRLDLMMTTSSIVAAVENKLWADWHDGPTQKQADRYREMGRRRLKGDATRKLGLVLLSEREGLKAGDYPDDYIHVSWRDIGVALRRALRQTWAPGEQHLLEVWPLVLTLVSIEQDLLGLSLLAKTPEGATARLRRLNDVATYLEGA